MNHLIIEFTCKNVCLHPDNTPGSTSASESPQTMGDSGGPDDVNIPLVFLYYQEGAHLLSALSANPELVVKIARSPLNPIEGESLIAALEQKGMNIEKGLKQGDHLIPRRKGIAM
jgi:hypothetical protein